MQLLVPSQTEQVDAVGTFDDAATQDLDGTAAWATGNGAVATVSAGLVTAAGDGMTGLTATWLGVVGAGSISVGGAVGTMFVILPNPISVMVSGTQQATCGTMTSTGFVPATCAWTTADAAVATESTSGLVTGVACGGASIGATSGSQSATATVTVTSVSCIGP